MENRRPDPRSRPAKENGPGENTDGAEGVQDYGTIAPVHGNPSLDPVTTPFDVARMAGYGNNSHDALQGVDKLVMGKVDARKEMHVDSETDGGPMAMGAKESIFSDDAGFGDMDLSLDPDEDPATTDWCHCLRTGEGERV